LGKQFWENERSRIKGMINPAVYIGVLRNKSRKENQLEYTTAVQVKNVKKIPPGLCGDTLETSMCAKFRYIGQHHYYDISQNTAYMINNTINNFFRNEHTKYSLPDEEMCFFVIDTALYDGTTCQMEWYTPISEKQ
jgi:AraC family transcriptional regulator